MTKEFIFVLIIVIVCLNFIFERYLSFLNIKNLKPQLPSDAEGIYTEEKYKRSQEYLKKKGKFGILTSSFSFIVLIMILFFNGFAFIDSIAKSISEHYILHSLIFFAILGLALDIISLPFSIYSTFKIEEEFGFNKTTPKVFIADKIKGWLLAIIIGGGLMAIIVWVYHITGQWFVILAIAIITLFSIFMSMFYTRLIVPIFNKLKPLPEGELKDAIEEFGNKAGFPLAKISIIDSSRRSTKSNAYFSGLGRKKRIVLFDTLIEKHTTEELVAILAHEIGHYKKKHILKGLLTGFVQTSALLFMLYLFLDYPVFQNAVGVTKTSFHIGIIVFGILYSPLSLLLGILDNYISRRNEYQADAFVAKFNLAPHLSDALKKLSSDNLSNLTPHPLYVFFNYSHPPLLKRLNNLKKYINNPDVNK